VDSYVKYYKANKINIRELKISHNNLHGAKSHLHEELTIGLAQKGASNICMNGEVYHIKEGDLFFIGSYISHSCNPVDKSIWKYTMIYMTENHGQDLFDSVDISDRVVVKSLDLKAQEELLELMMQVKNDGLEKDSVIKLDLKLKYYYDTADKNKKFSKIEDLEEIKKYIENHYTENFSIENLSELFNIEKFALIRKFKKHYLITPISYKTQLRLDYAKHLLLTEKNISTVAYKSGYYDQAHFTKEFRIVYGITPLQYQNSINDKKL